MQHVLARVGDRFGATALVILVTLSSGAARAAPQVVTYIDLPQAKTAQPVDQGNFAANNIGRVDVLVGEWIREYYTSEGRWDAQGSVIRPGRIRPVDLRAPVPSLAGLGGTAWPQGSPGSENWIIRENVSNWNHVLDGGSPANPLHGKRDSLQGIVSTNGFVFVTVGSRWDPNDIVTRWNGVSFFDGQADPATSFDPENNSIQELYSAGTGPTGPGDPEGDTGMLGAVPEGAFIAVTSPPTANSSRFLFVANYCGKDAAGYLLVQNISNLLAVRRPQRYLVPLYEYLGQYTDTAAPTSGASAPLGAEVPSSYFTAPTGDVGGNKTRAVVVVQVASDPEYANKDRRLLFVSVNLDPMLIEAGDGGTCPLTASCYASPYQPVDAFGLDDGKYDYLAIVDITDMVAAFPNPWPCQIGNCPDLWLYNDAAEWAERIRFLRLPPDLPAGWTIDTTSPPNPPLVAGDDWSMVPVPNPLGGPSTDVPILGSGTLSSIAAGPAGRSVYIGSNDQGDDEDGGYHVPHLYVLDLSQGDFTDQTFLNGYTPNVARYRFNKVIRSDFGSGNVGAICVASTIPAMPVTGTPTGPTLLGLGTPDNNLGMVYPGENQLDVEIRTRLTVVRNTNLPVAIDRLYIGIGGFAQNDATSAANWPSAGAILVLSLSTPGQPSYLRTLTIPQVPSGEWYQVAGLDLLPPRSEYIGTGAAAQRNVFVVTARHGDPFSSGPVDRLVVGEDPP